MKVWAFLMMVNFALWGLLSVAGFIFLLSIAFPKISKAVSRLFGRGWGDD
jgi:hypothetical protein